MKRNRKKKEFPTIHLMVMLKQMLESFLKVDCFGVD